MSEHAGTRSEVEDNALVSFGKDQIEESEYRAAHFGIMLYLGAKTRKILEK